MANNKLFLILFTAILATSCQKQPSSFNLEQVNNPEAQHIIAPGMSSVGIIHEDEILVYYLTESHQWMKDNISQFSIPSKNQGILAMGMGTIAVLQKDMLYFYYMDSAHQWNQDYELTMPLSEEFVRISAMKMPWQHGAIALEDHSGIIRFYYLDDNKQWKHDETANFTLPEGIEDYIMLGGMNIAIISDNKLGVYELNLDGKWEFIDDMVLSLPDETQAVLSFEPGVIMTLTDDQLWFYEIDFENRYWIMDDTMTFPLPV
ncbi:MAG: hypothetical protein ACLFS0_06175 [Bacteroidales bacterium]